MAPDGASSETKNRAAGTTFSGLNALNASSGKMSSVMRVPAVGASELTRMLYFAPSSPRVLANYDRPENLRARADDDIVLQGGVAFAADAIRRIGPAQRNALINRNVVTDFGRFANDGEAMVDKQMMANRRTGMNVDGGEKTRQVIDAAR